MSPEAIISITESLLHKCGDVRSEFNYDGKQIHVILRGTGSNSRMAAIRTPGSRWFSVEIEELFDHSFVDEDADDAEVRSYLLACTRIACAYIRNGAVEQRHGILRFRSLIVDVDGTPVRVQKIIGRRSQPRAGGPG